MVLQRPVELARLTGQRAISLRWIGCIIPPSDESHNSQRTHRHNRTSVGQPHPMEPHLGRIEVRASPGSLSARKTHGHEYRQRKAPCLYLPNRQDTSRLGNFGNPQQIRNRLDAASAVIRRNSRIHPRINRAADDSPRIALIRGFAALPLFFRDGSNDQLTSAAPRQRPLSLRDGSGDEFLNLWTRQRRH